MKKTILSGLFLLAGLCVQAQNEITIEGKVNNVKDGYVVTLFRNDGRVGTSIGTDTIEGGKFFFKVKPESGLDRLSVFVRSTDFPSMSRELFAAPNSVIQVNGNGNYIYTWSVKSKVKEQQEYDEYLYAAKDLLDRLQQVQAEVSGLWGIIDSSASTDEEKNTAKSKMKTLHQQSSDIQSEINLKEIALMKEKPVSMIWLDKLYGLSMSVRYNPACPFKEDVLALYQRMTDADKNSEQGKLITANIFPPVTVKVGDDMADGDLYDLEGNLHHLSELKGKYILLDFWSSGCGPCIMALPEMGELQKKYADKLAIVSLSSDTEKRWRGASKKHQMTWNNWSDKQQTAGLYVKYGVNGIPHYVLISPEGKMVDTWAGYGKGNLLRRLRTYMHPKPAMSVVKEAGKLLVNYPDYQTNKTNGVLEIKQVECRPDATVIRFKAYYTPNYWIRISEVATLHTSEGKQYKALKAEGITFDKEFFMPERGEAEFALIFEPLPMNTETFDFKEGKGQADWQIVGIRLAE